MIVIIFRLTIVFIVLFPKYVLNLLSLSWFYNLKLYPRMDSEIKELNIAWVVEVYCFVKEFLTLPFFILIPSINCTDLK